ncbi:hypothetical protein BHM03_00007573 [Ensete ventricosum]|nr:hypothetical protein BHM03_00007573 [Ensete ventricosum]
MINGPIGQIWVCAAGVERSTLHRCGLTGQRLSILGFLLFGIGYFGLASHILLSTRSRTAVAPLERLKILLQVE